VAQREISNYLENNKSKKECFNMSRVAIVTDTNNMLPTELLQKYRIKTVPLTLIMDGKTYRDVEEISMEEFWEKIKTTQQHFTGTPPPGDFVKVFKQIAGETDGIACSLVSKAMSATFQAASQAAKMAISENPALKIRIVDSKTAIGALGFIILEAARAAEAGKNLDEVVQVMENMVTRVSWITGLLTTQTRKFGRIPDQVFDGYTPENIPVITSFRGTGKVDDQGKASGIEDLYQKLIEVLAGNCDPAKPLHLMVHYSDLNQGQRLFKMLQEKLKCAEAYLTPYSPVICASSGAGLSITFYT
jgi:DegV family protein with EDD domain